MPRGDQTGPQGQGPKTGRAKGYCAGSDSPGYADTAPGQGQGNRNRRGAGGGKGNRGTGRGAGRGFGQGYGCGTGRGRGRGWNAQRPADLTQTGQTGTVPEIETLRNEVQQLRKKLTQLETPQNDPQS